MEAITNIASTVTTTASKAIWGDQTNAKTTQSNETAGQEPVSGQLGKGTAEEPYDQGNAATTPGIDDSKPLTSNLKDGSTESNPVESTDKAGVTLKNPEPLKLSEVTASNPTPVIPSTSTDIDSKDKNPVEKTLDPHDHLGEPLKVHEGTQALGEIQEEPPSSKAGNPSDQEHSKEAKGTGEEKVKSSGLATDGGDFDAAKPGAGKEADRLLEDNSVKKTEAGSTGATATNTTSNEANAPEKKEKVHTLDKIKNKLHIGHKDK